MKPLRSPRAGAILGSFIAAAAAYFGLNVIEDASASRHELWAQDAKPAASGKAAAAKADPLDWPMWRGPEQNGVSREKNLPSSWSPEGENLLWRKTEYATRSTPIVMRGKLFTHCRHKPETTEEGEKIVCVDAETGRLIWENIFNVFLTDAPAERVGWASVVGDPETGNVFALGLCGLFQAIDGETGKTLWSHSMSEEYGSLSTYGGRTNFPIVFEDLVIISAVMTGWGDYAVPAHRFVAFNKNTGEAVWLLSTRLRPEDTTYSTPVLTVFNGVQVMVFGAGDGSIYAVQPRTGKVVWKYDASTRGINTTPNISGNTIYVGHGEQIAQDTSTLGAVLALDGTGSGDVTGTKKLLWQIPARTISRSQPLLIDDKLYVVEDGAALFAMSAKTGKDLGRQKLGTIMFGSMVYGDGKIYCGEATGRWYIMEPTEKGVKIVHKLRLEEEEILGSPIISHGRIYLPTNAAMYCIGNKDVKPSADPIPEPVKEAPTANDTKPAHLQLVPVEALLKPGVKQKYTAKVYNAAGRYLETVKANIAVQGAGKVDANGEFIAATDAGHHAVVLTATYNGLEAKSRARVVPDLPWNFDFTDKEVPITWVGARYRHVTREVDGSSALVKITTIPKGTRSQAWMGHPTLHDYTIQADFRGASKDGKLPDMGLINQRYTLDLMGAAQQIQIRSWTPRLELRFAKSLKFEWKPESWYTLKFQSENKAGKAVLRGKVWPRDQKEPTEWTIEAADGTPNVTGSPGLFGNANNSEITIDNVKVFANK